MSQSLEIPPFSQTFDQPEMETESKINDRLT